MVVWRGSVLREGDFFVICYQEVFRDIEFQFRFRILFYLQVNRILGEQVKVLEDWFGRVVVIFRKVWVGGDLICFWFYYFFVQVLNKLVLFFYFKLMLF